MRKIKIILFLFIVCTLNCFCQYDFSKVDKIALKAPETNDLEELSDFFNRKIDGDIDKIRAFYVWIGDHIAYSVEDMYKVEYYTSTDQFIKKVLTSKRTVCHGYAEVMNALNKSAGIPSFVVSGYVRQNGKVSTIPHSWVVARIDSAWYVFDPTWGAGYVDQNIFVKHFNNDFFLINPQVSIHTRMPYDPLWQLLEYPLSHQDFYRDKSPVHQPYFNYKDTITQLSNKTEVECLEESCRRIKQWGFKNNLITEYYKFNVKQLEIEKANEIIFLTNQAVDQYNQAIGTFNNYVSAKNKHFKSPDLSDFEVADLIDLAKEQSIKAQSMLVSAKTINKEVLGNISKQKAQISELQKMIDNEKKFVDKYCKTKKNLRQQLFFKPA